MKEEIKKALEEKGIFPKKTLGQNFLISKTVLQKIINEAELKQNSVILEIGPGSGVLTKALAKKAKLVVAVEKDKRMVQFLKEALKDFKNINIIEGDILKFQFSNLKNYKLVANLPYYITAPVIRIFLEALSPPELMVLMVQKEVAQRICASPPKMSKIAVFSQFYGTSKIISYVPKTSFWPQPKVDSAIIKILPKKPVLKKREIKMFSRIVSAGFSHPRKQIAKNLSKGLSIPREKINRWLMKNNIKLTKRAEALEIKDWINLVKNCKFF
jgi:16S rRNA (adenine1518-N6/adenine1519-N6)-dimethyltransferase